MTNNNHNPARLSTSEKEEMKHSFMAFMEANPVPAAAPQRILSPYFPHLIRVPAFVAAFLVMVGGTAYAAENSLPNDFLYPIKTEVLEPVFIQAPARSPLAKANASQTLVERRLQEAEALIDQNEMDAGSAALITEAVTEHTTAVKAFAAEASRIGEVSDALAVTTDLQNTLEAHATVLASVADDTGAATVTVQDLIEAVSAHADAVEVIGESIEDQATATATSETNEYISDASSEASEAIADLRENLTTITATENEELITQATALLSQSEAAYAAATDALATGSTTEALSQIRDAVQNAGQGAILIDSPEALAE